LIPPASGATVENFIASIRSAGLASFTIRKIAPTSKLEITEFVAIVLRTHARTDTRQTGLRYGNPAIISFQTTTLVLLGKRPASATDDREINQRASAELPILLSSFDRIAVDSRAKRWHIEVLTT
ncbi:MAG: hypothetical protein WA832_15525, partial [Bradyrhizobium sp.]